MSDPLETELDALFQLPAAEMVAARNALVSRLKKAGQREAAVRVSALKRPAPAAWAINQIYFQARDLLEQALAEVTRVRELQASEGFDRQQLAAAVASQRVSLQAVVDAALRNLVASGLPNNGPYERRVFATVQGWLGGSGDEAPGRMTRELEPSGFESLGQLGVPAPLPAAAAQPGGAPPTAAAQHQGDGTSRSTAAQDSGGGAQLSAAAQPAALARRAREQAEALVLERRQALEWADGRLSEQRKKHAAAQAAVDRAEHDVEDAERALALRRAALKERQAEHANRQHDLDDAERARKAAEDALTLARAELQKL